MPLPRVARPSSLLSSLSGPLLPPIFTIMSTAISSDSAVPLPAHKTKHFSLLDYRFRNCTLQLAQLDDGNTNGTALWMGAQVLSVFLAQHLDHRPRVNEALPARRPRVLELGSGIGLSAYVCLLPRHRSASGATALSPSLLGYLHWSL
jgi:predicted nicotinamide N-methyase